MHKLKFYNLDLKLVQELNHALLLLSPSKRTLYPYTHQHSMNLTVLKQSRVAHCAGYASTSTWPCMYVTVCQHVHVHTNMTVCEYRYPVFIPRHSSRSNLAQSNYSGLWHRYACHQKIFISIAKQETRQGTVWAWVTHTAVVCNVQNATMMTLHISCSLGLLGMQCAMHVCCTHGHSLTDWGRPCWSD